MFLNVVGSAIIIVLGGGGCIIVVKALVCTGRLFLNAHVTLSSALRVTALRLVTVGGVLGGDSVAAGTRSCGWGGSVFRQVVVGRCND